VNLPGQLHGRPCMLRLRIHNRWCDDLMQYESFATRLLHYIELSKLLKLCNLQCAACSYLFICRINAWLLEESKVASLESWPNRDSILRVFFFHPILEHKRIL
jgi:hypothetical protein